MAIGGGKNDNVAAGLRYLVERLLLRRVEEHPGLTRDYGFRSIAALSLPSM